MRARDLAKITAARAMLCRSGMADEKLNGDMAGYLTRDELRQVLCEELTIRDTRLDGIDQRLDGVDQRLDGIDRRFDNFEQRMIHSMGQMAIAIGEEVGRQI